MTHVLVIAGLFDRTITLGIGLAIGFALGYMVHARQEAHEALTKVEEFLQTHENCPITQLPPKEETDL